MSSGSGMEQTERNLSKPKISFDPRVRCYFAKGRWLSKQIVWFTKLDITNQSWKQTVVQSGLMTFHRIEERS